MIMSAFRASRGGTAGDNCEQASLPHGRYGKLLMTAADLNIGGHYDEEHARWYPPPGLVQISAAVWWRGTFTHPPVMAGWPPAAPVIKIWKNGAWTDGIWHGTELKAGVGAAPAGFPNTAMAILPAMPDVAAPGDYYELYASGHSVNGDDDVLIDGHHAHSWWAGMHLCDEGQ